MENLDNFIGEKFKLLEKSSLNNPHSILGRHQSIEDQKQIVIRAYCPTAKKVTVISNKDRKKRYPMRSIGYGGLFEVCIEEGKQFIYQLECEEEEGHVWSYIDPYQFESIFTEESLYLYGVGNDYQIQEKLGANFTEVRGIKGVNFAVWAPHAKRVSVIGAFNQWDGRRHSMRFIPSQGIWELFIPEIKEGEIYKYEIKTQNDELLYKTDPYADYYELRPNSAAVVYNTNKYRWKDKRWLNVRAKRDYKKCPVSIYEVHIGSWKMHESGEFYNYREIADELVTYVKEMGYTHVELIGISEYPYDGSWGYQVTGYFAPTSRYGTPDDFKYFVEIMHKNNIGVILDWVPGHFPKDAFALEKFDGQALYESSDERRAHHPQWGTLIFDYSKPQVRLFLIASAISWIKNYHIDGIRVDAVASMLYLDFGREGDFVPNVYGGRENLDAIEFLKHLNSYIGGNFPGVIMIAEDSTAWPDVSKPVSEGGLGFYFKWNMGWMNDFLRYMSTEPYCRKYVHDKITFSLMYAFNENFIQVLSHDEVVHGKSSMIYKMPGSNSDKFANLRAAYGYMFTHPGKKMLFMGNDFAQTREWSEKRSLDWALLQYKEHKGIQLYIKELNTLYKKHKALWELREGYENFEWIECNNKEQGVIVYLRKALDRKEQLIIVSNFEANCYESYRVGLPEEAEYIELLNSDAERFGGLNRVNEGRLISKRIPWQGQPCSLEVNIPPLSVIIFKIRRLIKKKE